MLEMFLLVPRMGVRERAEDLEKKLRENHAAARVLLCGVMHKHYTGFILMEWWNDVPDAFFQFLDQSTTCYGYAVYQGTRFPLPATGT